MPVLNPPQKIIPPTKLTLVSAKMEYLALGFLSISQKRLKAPNLTSLIILSNQSNTTWEHTCANPKLIPA